MKTALIALTVGVTLAAAGCSLDSATKSANTIDVVVGYQSKTINTVTAGTLLRAQGYLERESAQTLGVVDISFPILGPDNTALATLTCPYIRRIDRHVGPDMAQVREYLREAAAAPSLTQGMSAA